MAALRRSKVYLKKAAIMKLLRIDRAVLLCEPLQRSWFASAETPSKDANKGPGVGFDAEPGISTRIDCPCSCSPNGGRAYIMWMSHLHEINWQQI